MKTGLIAIVASLSFANACAQKLITCTDKCLTVFVSCQNYQGKTVLLKNQKLYANFFGKGTFYVATDDNGVAKITHDLKHEGFRLNGVGGNGIVAGCNSGDIKKLKNKMHVTLFGEDCGLVPACVPRGD